MRVIKSDRMGNKAANIIIRNKYYIDKVNLAQLTKMSVTSSTAWDHAAEDYLIGETFTKKFSYDALRLTVGV